jgi:dipeptidyl aminopeptidase/acylaminoacyl peptidase
LAIALDLVAAMLGVDLRGMAARVSATVIPSHMASRRVLVATLLVACAPTRPASSTPPASATPPPAAPVARADPTLIPRSVLWGNAERASPTLSPDGRHLLYLAPVDGVMNIWVGPADQPDAARPVTRQKPRPIYFADWSADGSRILYLRDQAGDENEHVHAVDPTSREDIDLTPYPGVAAQIVAVRDRHPHAILVALNDRDPAWHDLYRVDIRTGIRTLVHRNEQQLLGYIVDDDLRLRFASRYPGAGFELVAPTGRGASKSVLRVGLEDALTTEGVGLDAAGKTLYLADSRGRETAALVGRDSASGKERVLAEDARAGLTSLIFDRKTRRPLAVSFTHLRQEWRALDPAITDDLVALQTAASGEFEVVSQSRDDTRWIVLYLADDGPHRWYLYERPQRRVTLLMVADAELAAQPLVPMHPVIIPARDGLELPSYYSLPRAADPDGDGLPAVPLPTVLVVHGGPWDRDHWGFNRDHQWLADRGYAVLSVNFRGSTGFTKRFVNAGDHEIAGKMHDDLVDAVHWAVQRKLSDPARIGIMGGSYGGYASLVGLTFTPDVFACGVSVVGPSNLETLLRNTPTYWAGLAETFAVRMGDYNTEAGRKLLHDRSPLHRVDAITRPLLIVQGANDPRVKQAESDQIVAAMTARKLPVTYLLYPDEGHGLARPENLVSSQAISESFLAHCLGGSYQPIGDDLRSSSLQVKVGAEHVPGLTEALARLPPTPPPAAP